MKIITAIRNWLFPILVQQRLQISELQYTVQTAQQLLHEQQGRAKSLQLVLEYILSAPINYYR